MVMIDDDDDDHDDDSDDNDDGEEEADDDCFNLCRAVARAGRPRLDARDHL